MDENQTAEPVGSDLYVGDLRRRADHEGKIGEVQKVRFLPPRKRQSSVDTPRVFSGPMVDVCVTERKNSVHEKPGEDNGYGGDEHI